MGFFDSFANNRMVKPDDDASSGPRCLSELSHEEKLKKADEIFRDYDVAFLPSELYPTCQGDFKLCSLVVYKLVARFYEDNNHCEPVDNVNWLPYLPMRYCGGNMVFGRIFSINMCAFPSSDAIIGFRNVGLKKLVKGFKILKGLRYMGERNEWTLFKLNSRATDDMTAMLYMPLEKNFYLEFAHFPVASDPVTILRFKF